MGTSHLSGLVAHAAATWALTGLIWFVQVVHYPLFASVDPASFPAYHAAHTRLTTRVVAPLMLAELGLAIWLVAGRPHASWAAWSGLALVVLIWLATFGLAVPRHATLAEAATMASLVAVNRVRTAAWTVRAALAAWLLVVPGSS